MIFRWVVTPCVDEPMAASASTFGRVSIAATLGLCGLVTLGMSVSHSGHELGILESSGQHDAAGPATVLSALAEEAEDPSRHVGAVHALEGVEPPTAATIDAAVVAAERSDLRAIERGARTMTPGSFIYSHAPIAAPARAAEQGV